MDDKCFLILAQVSFPTFLISLAFSDQPIRDTIFGYNIGIFACWICNRIVQANGKRISKKSKNIK